MKHSTMSTASIFSGSRNNTLILLLVLLLFTSTCAPKKTEEAPPAEQAAEPETEVPALTAAYETDTVFRAQYSRAVQAYFTLKDALVASDAEATRLAAAALGKAIASVNGDLLTGAARNDWSTFTPELGKSLREIATATDLESARAAFSTVSESMWKTIKAFGGGGELVYHDYCPMALKNKGAYWISSAKEIRNPYFGDAMLDCGYIKEKLN